MDNSLITSARGLVDQLVVWRRHLHANPELSRGEEQTARFVAGELRKLGYEPHEHVGDTWGLTTTLKVNDAPAIALRADMDALPLTEETGLDYASKQPGVMHACGHDTHMAMLLGAAKLLKDHKSQLKRSVKLIFQPAEEMRPGGAATLIEAGVLDDVDCILGLHIWSEMPLGTLGTRIGPFMASVDDIEITIRGKGGHAAMPQQCIDPVVVAAEIILALQSVVSRTIAMTDSAVVSITQVQAGTAYNIVPESVELRGTIRTLGEGTRAKVQSRIRQIVQGVAQAHGASAEIELPTGYPTLVNNKEMVERVCATARALGFTDDRLLTLPAQGGAEDFAYYAQKLPAVFVFLGARNEAKGCIYPHHHPRFNIDEDAQPLGAAFLAQFALDAEAS